MYTQIRSETNFKDCYPKLSDEFWKELSDLLEDGWKIYQTKNVSQPGYPDYIYYCLKKRIW